MTTHNEFNRSHVDETRQSGQYVRNFYENGGLRGTFYRVAAVGGNKKLNIAPPNAGQNAINAQALNDVTDHFYDTGEILKIKGYEIVDYG